MYSTQKPSYGLSGKVSSDVPSGRAMLARFGITVRSVLVPKLVLTVTLHLERVVKWSI